MTRRLVLSLLALPMAALLVPSLAFAQTAPPPAVPLTTPELVMLSVSFLLAACTQMQASGKVFGQFVIPPKVMILLGIVVPFLGGFASSLSSVAFSGSAVGRAIFAGLMNLFVGAVPGLAVHAHITVPQMMSERAARLAAKAASGVAALAFVITMSTSGCAWLKANEPAIAADTTQLFECIVAQAVSGNTSAQAIGLKCAAPASFDVLGFITGLLAQMSAAAPDAAPSAGFSPSDPRAAFIAVLKAVH